MADDFSFKSSNEMFENLIGNVSESIEFYKVLTINNCSYQVIFLLLL